ncbi:MAG: STAS/SEC14 domain-containing protein [Acidobacteriota bacterium]|jgi:hypothetical protein|nr:STAS/SEC14 domain-containing protein [Acidobacteriota bacterium]
MPTTRPNKKISTNELAVLSQSDLDNFINQAIVLRAKRRAPSVSQNESELLLEINRGLSPKMQKRFDELAEKIESETISQAERQEFSRLTDFVEKHDAKRIRLIGRLAEIRRQTFDEVMKDLGIGQS